MECHQREGTSYKPQLMHLLVGRMKQSSLLLNHDIYTIFLFPVLTGEINFKSYTLWARTLTKSDNTYMKNLFSFKRTTKELSVWLSLLYVQTALLQKVENHQVTSASVFCCLFFVNHLSYQAREGMHSVSQTRTTKHNN